MSRRPWGKRVLVRATTESLDLTLLEIGAAAAVVAIGAFVQGTIGFGIALVAVPFIAMIEPDLLPGPFVASLFLALLMVWRERTAVEGGPIALSSLGLILGTAAGAALLVIVPRDDLPELFAVLILIAIALSACGVQVPIGRASLIVAGAIGGIMGTMAGVHGAAMALLYQAETGERVRATLAAFFIAGYAISLLGLAVVDRFGRIELLAGLALCPGILAGWLLAPVAISRLDPGRLRPAILAISALAAVALFATG
jgi:uncharacterized protein